MTKREVTAQKLIDHIKAYPACQPADVFKYLFHCCFGCEHMVSSAKSAAEYIRKEAESASPEAVVEVLDGGKYARVYLGWVNEGLSAHTLGTLFTLSARREETGQDDLTEKLTVAEDLAKTGQFPFSYETFAGALGKWKEAGCPPLHHSECYRAAYHPAYRVIAAQYVPYLPLLAKLDTLLAKGPVCLAIDGGSASGKTTLAAMLEQTYGCTVIHTDDFFLQPHQRTARRLAEAGGNLDRERLLDEVLRPLSKKQTLRYRRFSCRTMTLEEPLQVQPEKLTVVEGVYSMHPELAGYYDLSVCLKISGEEQTRRIRLRNSPAMAQRYFQEWIPMENRYFSQTDLINRCDLQVCSQ